MKFIGSTLAALLVAATLPSQTHAFAGLSPPSSLSTRSRASSAFVPRTLSTPSRTTTSSSSRSSRSSSHSSSLLMSYTVAIVGATGAVGKEIRQCLEASSFPTSTLRIFGSARSAGTTIVSETFGSITVELFDVAKARDCDVVFLAVSGDFSLEHAEAISEGIHGAVVIDNSVRSILTIRRLPILQCVCRANVSLQFYCVSLYTYMNHHVYFYSPHSGTCHTFPWSFQKSMDNAPRVKNSLQTLTVQLPLVSWHCGHFTNFLVSKKLSWPPIKQLQEQDKREWTNSFKAPKSIWTEENLSILSLHIHSHSMSFLKLINFKKMDTRKKR